MTEFPDPWRDLGAFIREQRSGARLSLRRLSDISGISNPYLSQIERGLRRPSAEILQQIAKALQMSAETLYVRAGILDPREFGGDVTEAILTEPNLNEEQKQTLLRIYASFRRENGEPVGAAGSAGTGRAGDAGAAGSAVSPASTGGGASAGSAGAAASGGAGGFDEGEPSDGEGLVI